MIEKNSLNENAVAIKSQSHTVRAKKHGDKMMFAASDIVAACGIKAPCKWVKRAIDSRPDINGITLEYPVMTATGIRHIRMTFVTAGVARRMMNLLACPDETKKWILEEVLTYQNEPEAEEPALPEKTDEATDVCVTENELNRRIDNVLLELLELKRCLAAGAYRA